MKKMKKLLSWVLVMAMLFTNVEYAGAVNAASISPDESVVENVSGGSLIETVTDGDVSGGTVTEGDITEGDITDGDITDGDVTKGDVTEGDVTEGDVSVGDTTGGDVSVGDAEYTAPEYDAANGATVLYSGEVNGITWEITDDGLLTIAGEDTSERASRESMPWREYRDSITKVVITAKNVKDTYYWFGNCENIEEIDLTGFDTSSVTDMNYMFYACESLTSLDVSGFDTSKVTDMSWMFSSCESLTSLDVSGFDTSNVTDMSDMFWECRSLTDLDVSGFDTSKVTDMSWMFSGCRSLTSLDVSGFDTSKVTNTSWMFRGCSNLISIDVSGFDTSNVTGMSGMFSGCNDLICLDVSNFNTSMVTHMSEMFSACISLSSIDVSGFDVSNVTNMQDIFKNCKALTHIKSFSNLKISVNLPVSSMYDVNNKSYTEFPQNLSKGIDLYVGRKVTFYSEQYGDVLAVINARLGGTIALPENPMRDDYLFGGWFTEPDGSGTEFTAETVVEDNISVYAFWYQNGFWAAEVGSRTYTGKAIKPEVKVFDGNKLLTEKVDYTLSYKNNIKANDGYNKKTAPTIIVKGKGNYTGTETITFPIRAVYIDSYAVSCKDLMAVANNKVQKPIPELIHNGKKLKYKTDFTVSYPDFGDIEIFDAYKAPGTYTIRVEGKGNFTDIRDISFTIVDGILMSKTKIASIPKQLYTGSPIEPEVKVTYKGKTLVKDTDYTVAYKDNKYVGMATVIVTGKGDYSGTKEATFAIIKNSVDITKAKVSGIENKVYTGREQTQELAVTLNGEKLTSYLDYHVYYSDNTNTGTASVTIIGTGNYTGTIKKTFKITAYDIKEDTYKAVSGIPKNLTVVYTKGGVTPSLDLGFAGKKLVAKKDYTISYANNKKIAGATDKKAPTIKITGKGNFKGTVTVPFNIAAKDLKDSKNPITINVADAAYSAKAGKYISKPVLTDSDGKKLVAGTDYEKAITYSLQDGTVLDGKKDAPQAGSVIKVTVTGKGNYKGTLEATYRIAQASFKSANIKIDAQEYTGSGVTLNPDDITVKVGKTELVYGQDYVIVEDSYKNNTKKGTASVTLKGVGNYGGEKTVKFKIASKKLVWFWNLL